MLPTPNLDDRRFQDLVDDAKRLVQRRCPEWTDHNVSDPGITLIETVAFMIDQLLYRVNRIPDRLYLAYLDLLGVTLHPATAATADVTFWLSAPQEEPVVVPVDARVSTLRTEDDEAIGYATRRELVIPPRRLEHVATHAAGGEPSLQDQALRRGSGFASFADPPRPGDLMLLGLDGAAPSCAVALRFTCDVHGVGVNPDFPPLVWEAWDGAHWERCEVDSDGTGGLNTPGDVVLHLPANHAASVVAGQRGGWIRCRLLEPEPDMPYYSASPTVTEASAFTIGGTVVAVHAETVRGELLGESDGSPGQVFALERTPVVAGGHDITLEVTTAAGTETWTEVESFSGHGPGDRVFRLDRSMGEVHLPPAVREPDGALRTFGDVPAQGATVRVPEYRSGGGPRGNVAAHAISVLRSSVPLVHRVDNRRAAHGGVAAETVDEAKVRGPLVLRTRDRAVTASDFEQLARDAAPEIVRARCVVAGQDASDGSAIRVLVVPAAAPDDDGQLRFEDLMPTDESLAAVAEYLDERRLVGTRVVVEPPVYQGVTVVARLRARSRVSPQLLERSAVRALNGYLDPLTGGPDGTGWPFGRPVQVGDVHAVLQALPGTEIVEEVKLFPADPPTGRRGESMARIALDPHTLTFSYRPQVRATEAS